MVKYPVFVFDGCDGGVYTSESDVGSLEHQDVQRNVYVCYDDEGYRVRLEVVGRSLRLSRQDLALTEFLGKLRHCLEGARRPAPPEASFEELKMRISRLLGVYGSTGGF